MKKRGGRVKSKRKIGKWLFWTPRILSIIFILFLALFSLDVFGNNYTFWETVVGLFMHNIPALILLVILIMSWKHELVGAIVFALAGLAYLVLTIIRAALSTPAQWYMLFWALQIAGPAFLISYLFYLNYKKKKR